MKGHVAAASMLLAPVTMLLLVVLTLQHARLGCSVGTGSLSSELRQQQQQQQQQLLGAGGTSMRHAYAFYANSRAYFESALVNIARLRELGSTLPALVMLPQDIAATNSTHSAWPELREAAHAMGVQLVPTNFTADGVTSSGGASGYYRGVFEKLAVFGLPGWDRLLLLDADQIVLRNMDPLFTQLLPGPLAAPRSYWIKPGRFPARYAGSSGYDVGNGPEVGPQQKFGSYWMMLQPSEELWRSRLLPWFEPAPAPGAPGRHRLSLAALEARGVPLPTGQGIFTDMDVVNIEFKDDVELLPGNMVVPPDHLKAARDEEQQEAGAAERARRQAWLAGVWVVHMFGPKTWSLPMQQFPTKYPTPLPLLKQAWVDWWRLHDQLFPPPQEAGAGSGSGARRARRRSRRRSAGRKAARASGGRSGGSSSSSSNSSSSSRQQQSQEERGEVQR